MMKHGLIAFFAAATTIPLMAGPTAPDGWITVEFPNKEGSASKLVAMYSKDRASISIVEQPASRADAPVPTLAQVLKEQTQFKTGGREVAPLASGSMNVRSTAAVYADLLLQGAKRTEFNRVVVLERSGKVFTVVLSCDEAQKEEHLAVLNTFLETAEL